MLRSSLKNHSPGEPSVRQHGLADDVADGEDVGHVGANQDVNIDEAAVYDVNASFFC